MSLAMNDMIGNFDTGTKKFNKNILCLVIPVLVTEIIITLLVYSALLMLLSYI